METILNILKIGIFVISMFLYHTSMTNRFKYKKENTEISQLKAIDSTLWCLISLIIMIIAMVL